MSKPNVIIKKYSDRRLYDASASRYVKLEDVAAMVREGIDVQVLDARTGKDLTTVILAQIVMEDARERDTALPVQLLRQLVRASDRAAHDFLSWYLNSTLDLYQKAESSLRTRFTEAQSAVLSPLEFVRGLIGGHPFPPAAEPSETEQLRRRVAELEAQLERVKRPAKTRKKRKVAG